MRYELFVRTPEGWDSPILERGRTVTQNVADQIMTNYLNKHPGVTVFALRSYTQGIAPMKAISKRLDSLLVLQPDLPPEYGLPTA